MVIVDLTKKTIPNLTYRAIGPIGAHIMGVSIANTTFDRHFDEKVFKAIADGAPVTQIIVKGHEIGSNVLGGQQEYFLQFC